MKPRTPREPQRTAEDLRKGIARIEKRINDLNGFDPEKIQERWTNPEVEALQKAIAETLEAVFGPHTLSYARYSSAARLDNGPVYARSDFGSTRPRDERSDARKYLAQGKERSLALLSQAIRGLREELEAQESDSPRAAASRESRDSRIAPINVAPVEAANPGIGGSRRVEKTVFISYRRSALPWAQSLFQDLTHHGFDVFFDFQGIASGAFERVIFESIKARAHFLVLLTPTALDRCKDPQDLFRREIETAIDERRNIVPIMLDEFSFASSGIDQAELGDKLPTLRRYNGLPVHPAYVSEAMVRLRSTYLNVALDAVLHPVSREAEAVARNQQAEAAKARPVTEKELREAAQPRYSFKVKIEYDDVEQVVAGTRAEEPYGPGSLNIYDGDSIVARLSKVERWSRQAHPEE
jgi:hypothetical protein